MFTISEMAQSKKVRDEIEAWFKANESKLIVPGEAQKAKLADFKGPEGFSNVVGVGANPVMEAMNAQLEETKKTNEILLNMSTRDQPIKDFTKQNSFQDGYGDQM